MLHLSVNAFTVAIVCSHHEFAVRKTILTFILHAIFHAIKKDQEGNREPLVRRHSVSVEVHESFTANIGVKVRGVRVVRGRISLFPLPR
jgi:hypothetical protein